MARYLGVTPSTAHQGVPSRSEQISEHVNSPLHPAAVDPLLPLTNDRY